jgi:raffinose/stachyose/melibiose transport system substrate-binding protein
MIKLNSRKNAYGILMLVLVVLLASMATVNAAPKELKVFAVYGGTQKENFEKMFNEYSKINPGIKVTFDTCSGTGAATYQEVLQTSLGSGSGPDIYFEWGGELAGFFIDSGKAEPLERYYKKYNWKKKLMPWAVNYLERNKKIWGVPVAANGMTFQYRVDLFKKLGLQEPKSYTELEKLCEKVKAAGIYPLSLGGKYDWQTMRLLDYLIETTCGPKLHDQLNALQVSWNRPEVVKAFRLFRKWVEKGWITPGFLAVSPDDAKVPLYQGNALMIFEGSWMEATGFIPDGQDKKNFDFFFGPTGHTPKRISGFAEQFMISSLSKNKDEAAKLLDWLLQQDVQKKWLGSSFASSAVVGVTPDPEKLPRTCKWAKMLSNLSSVFPPTDQAFKSELLNRFFEVQDALVNGDITPAAGAKKFQKEVEAWKAKNMAK